MSRIFPATASVAAVALALGVGVGAGPLAESSADSAADREARLTARVAQLETRVDGLTGNADADRKAIAALAAPLVRDRLAGRTVVVVAAPDAEPADVRRATRALGGSGATVTGTLRLQETYLDPASAASPLEDLALRLVPPGVSFPEGATAIERVGTVLARAVVQQPEDGSKPETGIDSDAAEVIAGLDELDALRLDGEPGLRAELAVLVTGPDGSWDDPAMAGLTAALDAASRGAVVVTRAASGGDPVDGASTVGGLRSTAGVTALVLALAEQVEGGSGSYGTGDGSTAVLPSAVVPD